MENLSMVQTVTHTVYRKIVILCSVDIYRKRSLYQCCLLSFSKLAGAINAAYNHCLLSYFCVAEICREAECVLFQFSVSKALFVSLVKIC